MSRLDDLIYKFCPEGVKYEILDDVIVSLNTGLNPRKFFRLNTEDAINYYITIRELHNGKIVPSDKTDKINNEAMRLCNKRSNLEKGDVLFSGTGTIGEMAVIEETPKNWNIKEGVYAIKPKFDRLNSKFLYYLLGSSDIKSKYMLKIAGGTVKSIPMIEMKKLLIPVPPIEVQCEIVRILDNFTKLTTGLITKLTTELTMRKEQYEYYKDKLLNFDSNIKKMALGDIAVIVRGASPRPIKDFITNGKGINWIKIGDVTPGSKYITSCKERITEDGAKKSRYVKKGDFILSNSMSFGRPYILKIDGCIHDGWLSISGFEDYVTSDYLYYSLVSSDIQREMKKKASFGGAVQNLNADIVRGIEIPVPPLELQNKIVKILDRFNTIYTDFNIGLPAEIEARKKQYEYYRDKLLTFKEINI